MSLISPDFVGEEPVSLSRNPAQQLVKNVANLTLLEKKTQEVYIACIQGIQDACYC